MSTPTPAKCAACDTGFHLNGGSTACLANDCNCANGDAAEGSACTTHGGHMCVPGSCDAGYAIQGTDAFCSVLATTAAPVTPMCQMEWRAQSCGPSDPNNNCNWILSAQGGASVSI